MSASVLVPQLVATAPAEAVERILKKFLRSMCQSGLFSVMTGSAVVRCVILAMARNAGAHIMFHEGLGCNGVGHVAMAGGAGISRPLAAMAASFLISGLSVATFA